MAITHYPNVQIRSLRPRDVRKLFQGYTTRKQKKLDVNPSSLTPEAMCLLGSILPSPPGKQMSNVISPIINQFFFYPLPFPIFLFQGSGGGIFWWGKHCIYHFGRYMNLGGIWIISTQQASSLLRNGHTNPTGLLWRWSEIICMDVLHPGPRQ